VPRITAPGWRFELARRNIPFVKYGGLKFIEAAHVKDLLAILRWAENPRDTIAGFRALQLLPGIGPTTAKKATAYLAENGFDLIQLVGFAPPDAAACPGQNSAIYCGIYTLARSPGSGRSVLSGYGVSRISNGFTITQRCAWTTSNCWSRSRSAIPAVNAFWPNGRSNRPTQAAQMPTVRSSMKII
jgi:UvrD-like helicase C-terminal domain